MRSMVVLALAAGAALLGAQAGYAQEAGLFGLGTGSGNWTGVYGGVQADLLAHKSMEDSATLVAPTLFGDMGGGIGGFIGADYQMTDLIVAGVGAEANYDSTELLYQNNVIGKARWDAAIKARAGVPLASNVLLYGSLGYQWGHFDYSQNFTGPGYANAEFTVGGPQFGIGVDAMLTSNIMGRFEATYTHYGDNTVTLNGSPTWTMTPSIIAVKAGVGFKFD